MAINVLNTGSSSSRGESFTFQVDYDTTAQTIGLTCTGTGHARLILVEISNGQSVGSVFADQYGTTAGPIATAGSKDNAGQPNAGESASAVTYTGQRVIVAGPGATGVNVNGAAMPTQAVTAAQVGSAGANLSISLDWGPNSFALTGH